MDTINNDAEYDVAMTRYQKIKYAEPGSEEHNEKMNLVKLIDDYEQSLVDLEFKIAPIMTVEELMDEFGWSQEKAQKFLNNI